MFEVETETTIYEVSFDQVQINLTDSCNLQCKHCRCGQLSGVHLPVAEVMTALDLAAVHGHEDTEVIFSGGEPIYHPQLIDIIRKTRAARIDRINITTNGSTVTKEVLQTITEEKFKRCNFTVSVDSSSPDAHDCFRGSHGSFDTALGAIRDVTRLGLPSVAASIRSVVLPKTLHEIERLTELAISLECKAITFSLVFPTGNALVNQDTLPSPLLRQKFNAALKTARTRFGHLITIGTNEPTFHARLDSSKDCEYNGCVAGTAIVCISATGDVKPCSILDLPITSIVGKTVGDIISCYANSEIIKALLSRKLKGKCSSCPSIMSCGGCRARAYNATGDYLAEDPMCKTS